jgi:hypothetical protein
VLFLCTCSHDARVIDILDCTETFIIDVRVLPIMLLLLLMLFILCNIVVYAVVLVYYVVDCVVVYRRDVYTDRPRNIKVSQCNYNTYAVRSLKFRDLLHL